MQNTLKISFIISLLFLSFSCQEITKYSEIPAIIYKSHIANDSTDILGNKIKYVELTFSIIDGDGDFGLADYDTLPPFDTIYNYNFFSTLFAKTSEGYEEIEILLSSYRIPYIEVENGKAYKADIQIEFEYFHSLMPADTIKYEFYVVDKALNESNIEISPDIAFDLQ